MHCIRPSHTAGRTIRGVGAMRVMRAGQVRRLDGRGAAGQAWFVAGSFGVAA